MNENLLIAPKNTHNYPVQEGVTVWNQYLHNETSDKFEEAICWMTDEEPPKAIFINAVPNLIDNLLNIKHILKLLTDPNSAISIMGTLQGATTRINQIKPVLEILQQQIVVEDTND